jgi:Predicted signaling protein consisting of a modified GGDEF domain and a DHH domain
MVKANIVVRYHRRDQEGIRDPLYVSMDPNISCLNQISVELHASATVAYQMSNQFDVWFRTYFGIATILICMGDVQTIRCGTAVNTETYHSTTTQPRAWYSSILYITWFSTNLQPPSELLG